MDINSKNQSCFLTVEPDRPHHSVWDQFLKTHDHSCSSTNFDCTGFDTFCCSNELCLPFADDESCSGSSCNFNKPISAHGSTSTAIRPDSALSISDCNCCEIGCPPASVLGDHCLDCLPTHHSNLPEPITDNLVDTNGPLNDEIVWIDKELEELIRCCCCEEPTLSENLPTHHTDAHPSHRVNFDLFGNSQLPTTTTTKPRPTLSLNTSDPGALIVPNSSVAFVCEWNQCRSSFSSQRELADHVNLSHLFLTPSSTHNQRSGFSTPLLSSPTLSSQHQPQSISDQLQVFLATCCFPSPGPLDPSSELKTTPIPLSTNLTRDQGSFTSNNTTDSYRHICHWESCTGQSFSTTADLTEHISIAHVGTGRSQYSCRWKDCICVLGTSDRKQFTQRQKLMRHLQTHTGDRPYVCETCSKRFGESATLVQHRRTHTHEKPYKCKYPGCLKSFALQSALTIHTRTHTGLKPFKCNICDSSFSESSNLSKHMKTHTGSKPFECEKCEKKFARSDQLLRHGRIHESNKEEDGGLVNKRRKKNLV
ncbi:hypothetical protein CROQUDRAFT_660936 [Cronartium quercuum f. sp. fusiforme G11]|uniref:C2H2-type domain-containing protein n=1 Tax=Cronartium quercuum f. sp. fusiforme G11 TaxID=708437 RepID=A0A9P6NDM5_9BASI|nr:hypothetical protein CROQUDRAFT_660936 [Cronartium quercuum f. sp. fusiforme G11]